MDPQAKVKRNLRGVFNMKICSLTKVDCLTQQKREHVNMEVLVFCSGQMFGEERHLLIN